MTTGETMMKVMVKVKGINSRTRRFRDGGNLIDEMMQSVNFAATAPGYYAQPQEDALKAAYHVVAAWQKHIRTGRLSASFTLNLLSPWETLKVWVEMIDAGIDTCYAAEEYFKDFVRK